MCHFVRKFYLSRDGEIDIVTEKTVVDFPRIGLVELVQSLVFLMMARLEVAIRPLSAPFLFRTSGFSPSQAVSNSV